MNNEEANTIHCSEPSACEQATPITSNNVRARKTIKKKATMQRKTNKCSVGKKMMRGDNLKRHLIAKHSVILNSNQVIKAAHPYKDYHKSVACSVCCKVVRGDYLKKHIATKHKDVLSATDTAKKQSTTNEKKSFAAFDRKVASSTTCAMKTVTNMLHLAFKNIHDETVAFLESQGDDDASKRATNILASIEERLTNMLDEEFNRVANLLIIGHY